MFALDQHQFEQFCGAIEVSVVSFRRVVTFKQFRSMYTYCKLKLFIEENERAD